MENNSPEKNKFEPKHAGKAIDFSQRMKRLSSDPVVKEGATAGIRTVLNLGISLADFVPGGLGEVLDVVALIGKTVQRKSGEKPNSSKFSMDLTPDVPTWVPWISNLPELVTGGAFPSYAIPAGVQLEKDFPRMVNGVRQAIEIVKGEKNDYQDNQTQIDEAIEVFTNK